MNSLQAEMMAEQVWKMYDRNSNQFLDKEEMRRLFLDIAHTTHNETLLRNMDRFLELFGGRENGRISRADFSRLLQEK